MSATLLILTTVLFAPLLQEGEESVFEEPKIIQAGDKPIDVDIGHAAPFMVDLDGDGLKDLLVGQFGEGKLRIYRNVGTKESPKFDSFTWFQDGTKEGRVPTG